MEENKKKCACENDECAHEHKHKKCKCDDDCNCNEQHCECGCENEVDAIELISTLQRLQAEFDNYRKRTNEAEKKAFENGYFEATKNILRIMDTFLNAEKLEKDAKIKEVISTLLKQVKEILIAMKVEKINAVGEIFNPNFHEAILVENDADKKPDEILEEFQEGFIQNGRVLRHSVVKINK